MRKEKALTNLVANWRTGLSQEEKKKLYLQSIPEQVRAMAFEGEQVSQIYIRRYSR